MDLYTANKQVISQLDFLTPNDIKNCIKELGEKFLQKINEEKNYEVKTPYAMMLCHELRDYTVFNFLNNDLDKFADEVRACCESRGGVYAVEEADDESAIEIWIQPEDEDEPHLFYIFPYSYGVIEI